MLRSADPPWTIQKAGVAIGLVSIASFFIALILAYFFALRSQVQGSVVNVPATLWLSTAEILASSATLELARRALKRADLREYRRGLACTLGLGFIFVLTQVACWLELVRQGVYVAGNPRGSVFYVFTGLHAAHVLGGLLWMWVRWRASAALPSGGEGELRRQRVSLTAAAIYWHFMAALWAVLFALLLTWASRG